MNHFIDLNGITVEAMVNASGFVENTLQVSEQLNFEDVWTVTELCFSPMQRSSALKRKCVVLILRCCSCYLPRVVQLHLLDYWCLYM